MFRFLCTAIFIFISFAAISQPLVSFSNTSFAEPSKGWTNLILLKDGNTIFFNGNESVMVMKVFDKDRKEILNKNIPYKASVKGGIPGKSQFVKAVFEQNGNVVLLVASTNGCGLGGYINCVQSLYRFVIEPLSGKIVSADKLCDAEKIRSWGYNLDAMALNDIMVARDPVTDRYAVLVFNGYTPMKEKLDRVRLLTFDGNNQLLKSVVLDAPSTTGKAIHFAGFTMYDKTVFLGTNKRDAENKNGDVPLCISVLKDGADDFESKEFQIKPFAMNSDNQLVFNPESGSLNMLTTTEHIKELKGGILSNGESIRELSCRFSDIDVKEMVIKTSAEIDYSGLDALVTQRFGQKYGFRGNAPQVRLNVDGTITVLPEQRAELSRQRPVSMSGGSSGMTTYGTSTYVSKLGIIKLDKKISASESKVIRLRPIGDPNMAGSAGAYYFDFCYVGSGSDYIVINDIDVNFDKPESEKPQIMTTISESNTILCKVSKSGIEKSYLFGKPQKKNENRFAMIGNSIYDQESSTWITVVVNGQDKRSRLAWVTLN